MGTTLKKVLTHLAFEPNAMHIWVAKKRCRRNCLIIPTESEECRYQVKAAQGLIAFYDDTGLRMQYIPCISEEYYHFMEI